MTGCSNRYHVTEPEGTVQNEIYEIDCNAYRRTDNNEEIYENSALRDQE